MSLFLHEMDPAGPLPPAEAVAKSVIVSYDMDGDGMLSIAELKHHFGRLFKGDSISTTPQEIHLACSDDVSQMRVMWAAHLHYTGLPTVKYGMSAVSLNRSVTGVNYQYSVANGSWTSMPMYRAVMTNLVPSVMYFYQVGGDDSWSDVMNFTSSPAVGSTESLSFAVYGDMGTVMPFGYAVTDELIEANRQQPFRAALHVGDIAYAGVNSWGAYEPIWDLYMNQIQPFASHVPYQVAVGNHEAYYNYEAYNKRFKMPGNSSSEGVDTFFWWSYNFGNVHFTATSSEHNYTTGSPQWEWIKQDLAKAAKMRAEGTIAWIIVGFHRPAYSSDQDEWSSHKPGAPLLKYLEPFFMEYGVDVVLTGHMHCYETTWPVNNGTVISKGVDGTFTNPAAPIYVVQGTAGAVIWEKWVEPAPAWSRTRAQLYGYGRMNTERDTQHGVDRLTYQFFSKKNLVDSFVIERTVVTRQE
jgi:acid phosphatase type 7